MARETWLSRRLRPGNARRLVVSRTRDAATRLPGTRHLVVCGDDPLAYRLVDELVSRYSRPVTVILTDRRRNHGPRIARIPGVRIVEAERLDSDAFRAARINNADAVALVRQDDVGNIHAALQAQELNPRVHLVIRMFNMNLGRGIREMFAESAIISDAAMAAPAFVAAALGEVAPLHVRLPGRTLFVARRYEVAPEEIVCGIAVTRPNGQPELLPADEDRADLVLAATTSDDHAEPAPIGPLRRWWRRHRNPLRLVRLILDRKLTLAALLLVAVLLIGTGVFATAQGLDWVDAAYLTLLSALGGADPDIGASGWEKVVQTLLTLVSIALIPVVTAAVVEVVVNARLAVALGRLKEPIEDHVVVVGLGNVGTRVIRQLHRRGIPVVAIDKSESARGVQLARELEVPLVIGDASREETLRAASVDRCRALVVVSTDDVTNLEAALHGRSLQPSLRVVLRLFDGDFADRVQRAFGITISRSVSYLAAPAFAAAMMEREIIGTIPVNRRVLLVADVPVCAGSPLHGAALPTTRQVPGARVIGLLSEGLMRWSPPPGQPLRADDRLIVIATRDGLGRMLRLTVSTPSE